MKTFKTIMLTLLGLIIVALMAGILLITGIKRGALPEYNGEQVISGLTKEVTVYRDERGMPHIYADNENDLYFATGYIMAQERLWQMDLIRRATTGRLSEIFGDDYIQTDLFLRSLDMTTKSKMILSNGQKSLIDCIQAYTDGVNAYIADAGRRLPPEFRILSYKPDNWSLEDIANIIGYIGWDLASGNLSADIFNYRLVQKLGAEKATKLIPDWKVETTTVFPEFKLKDESLKEAEMFIASLDKLKALGIHSFSGSNNWVVSGSRSTTGKPLFSNDMHLGLTSPGIWMQMHQVIPGKLNVTGVLVPGEPFIVAGHNEKIAWGMTNLMVDDIDLFAEKINPENENQYYLNGEWRDMMIRHEVIKSKKGRVDTLPLRFTHRGPVISGFRNIDDAVLSMRWSGYDQSDELRTVFELNYASGWEDFKSALTHFRSISQNVAFTDVNGNIGLVTAGGIPVRKGYGSIIRSGETDEFDWKGYVSPEHLPFSYNPDKGYVSSANNKTVTDDYPYYISFRFYVPYRINRIRQMIEEKDKLGIDDFKRLLTDLQSDYAALLTPFILKLKDRLPEMNSLEKDAYNTLEEWDYEMNENKVAPSLFEFFSISFARNLLADELDDLYNQLPGSVKDNYIYKLLKNGPDEWVDNVNTQEMETLDDIILKSFKDEIRILSENYGNEINKWTWGSIHKITLEHPLGTVKLLDRIFRLNSDTYAIGGSSHTVCPATYTEGFKVTDGASERHIYNTADWDESYTVIPTGASGIPASEFYLSQTKTYVEGKFYKDPFTEGAVKAAAKYTLLLKPDK
ncbi:MAG TPA: penicillin acylase family protein [Bacteroidales bacterium]|nr:penicillin acylase family protein [Bacteroidales bacterium]